MYLHIGGGEGHTQKQATIDKKSKMIRRFRVERGLVLSHILAQSTPGEKTKCGMCDSTQGFVRL